MHGFKGFKGFKPCAYAYILTMMSRVPMHILASSTLLFLSMAYNFAEGFRNNVIVKGTTINPKLRKQEASGMYGK